MISQTFSSPMGAAPIIAFVIIAATAAAADEQHDHHHGDKPCPHAGAETVESEEKQPELDEIHLHRGEPVNWTNGDGAHIGGILFPELFVQGIFGDSTADPQGLANGDHDPVTQVMLQSLHFAVDVQLGSYLTGFANFDGGTDANDDFRGVLEEGFIHLQALDWLSIGGGQFLNAFGFHNELHVHAWEFVDQNLVNGRMLNEGELTTQGGELIIGLPTPWQSSLTIGGGGVSSHAHGEHDHGQGEGEPPFEPDGANFDAWVVTGSYRADYGAHEHMAGTVSAAVGENGFGEITQVYGIGHEIVWNRVQPLYDAKNAVIGEFRGGSFGAGSLRWRSEIMFRNVEALGGGHHEDEDEHGHEEEHGHGHEEHHDDGHDDHDDEHDDNEARVAATLDELGFYSQLQYGINDFAVASLRGEWVSGIDELGLDERFRVSPALSVYLNASRNLQVRLQYNFDHSADFGDEHSVWLQFSYSWGAHGDHGHHHH